MTIEEVIKSMRDSVWAIDDAMSKQLREETYKCVERNVGHLSNLVSNPEISGYSGDISDIYNAISNGNKFLEDNSYILSSNPTE
jgi:hypothetical protein